MGRPGIPLLLSFVLLLTGRPLVFAQSGPLLHSAAPAPNEPLLHYTLTVDPSDHSGYNVTIRIEHAPHRFHLAMATHHEYDDCFWRFVSGFHTAPPATFTREDSAVWAITTTGDDVTVSYRISLPPPAPLHFSHRPFLTSYGGLVGDLHSFMYLVEDIHAPCRLTLRLPPGWSSAGSEIPSTTAPRLLDAPILVGRLHKWNFTIDGTPHEVVYLSSAPTLTFDTVALVANIQKIVRAAEDVFKSFPYKQYTFLFEDASAGALEHGSSVTIGATPADLSNPASGIYGEIAHEFFHSWNGMYIQPTGYTELNYGPQQLTTGLWFSEGVTMLYADLIARRTGLPVEDSTRLSHLTHLITRYYRDTGNCVLPPAKVSLADYVQPGPLGDYSASTHLQGELLGTCLDFLIRDATDGRRSLDDVMREVFIHYGNKQPFTDSAIEEASTTVCQCDAAHSFFHDYLYQGKPIDFATYLGRLGLRLQRDQPAATDPQGHLLPDTRVYSWILRDDTSLRIGISNPNSCWAKAGLHTGNIITAINGRPIHTRQDFQTAMRIVHIGDTVIARTKKETGTISVPVCISGYTTPVITLTEDPAATSKQRRLLQQWKDGSN
jgi:predicted metalloprotease with PDZ domain